MTRYEDHGVRPGCSLIRLSWDANRGPQTILYRYDTAASHHEDHLTRQGVKVERTSCEWDGNEYVSTDNGD